MPRRLLLLVACLLLLVMRCRGGSPGYAPTAAGRGVCRKVRFATFNTSLNRDRDGQLLAELTSGASSQAANISAILQHVRPDVLLMNEFDYVAGGAAVAAFQRLYLEVPQAPDLQPLRFDHVFIAPVNTGLPSGRDFDHDGTSAGPQDCFGYGFHPGQYGMVLLSRFPIDASAARTFQHFLWRDMPGALLPTDPRTGKPWYSPEDLRVFRLSSKSHWIVPLDIPCNDQQQQSGRAAGGGSSRRVHMLLHHPTPPVFDGREHRNRLRNHDEIRLMADIIGCSSSSSSSSSSDNGSSSSDSGSSSYIYDDNGLTGGLEAGASFVVMGDHNADPNDGQSAHHAIRQLLDCPRINAAFVPTSEGGQEAGNRRRGDRTPPETKTSSFDLRVDFVLPSRDLAVAGGGVWWPVRADPLSALLVASDHRPVFLDVEVGADAGAGGVAVAKVTAATKQQLLQQGGRQREQRPGTTGIGVAAAAAV